MSMTHSDTPALNLRMYAIFSPLNDAQLASIAPLVRQRRLDRGEIACRKDDAADGLYLLASGQLQVFEITEDGREVGLNLIQPGTFFGELSVIDDLPRSAHIVATEPSVIGLLPRWTHAGLRCCPLQAQSRTSWRTTTCGGFGSGCPKTGMLPFLTAPGTGAYW